MKTKFAVLAVVSLVPAMCLLGAQGCSSSGKSGDNAGGESGGGGDGEGGEGGSQGGESGKASGSGGNGGKGSGGAAQGGSGGSAMGGSGGQLSSVNTATCMPPKLKLTRITTAQGPMALVQAQGDDRIFVAERAGLIRILRGNTFAATPFMDLRPSILNMPNTGTHERGLLNMALHPNFATNGRFYVFYNRRPMDPLSQGESGAIVIAEGKQQQGDRDKAETTLKVLTTVATKDDHHIGGFLAFGPDGMLYAGIGDGGGGIDSSGAGQDPTRRLAKILRIDVENPESKPAGNLDKPGADRHAWAYGVRNPFRGSFDRATGDLYFGDVGEASYEEVNFVPPGKTGLNFGWGYDPSKTEGQHQVQTGMEGRHPIPYFTAVKWEPFGYLPVYEYQHSGNGWEISPASYQRMGGQCTTGITMESECARAVMGGRVYRGKAIPELYGRYIFGDYIRNWVMSFIVKDGEATCYADLTQDLDTGDTRLQGLNNFAEDASGELYVTDLSVGNIYKIEKE